MKFNKNILFIFSSTIQNTDPAAKSIFQIHQALENRGFHISIADSIEDGLKLLKASPRYSMIGLIWDQGNQKINAESEALISTIRERNGFVAQTYL